MSIFSDYSEHDIEYHNECVRVAPVQLTRIT